MRYATGSVNASMAGGVDEKTFRLWFWQFVDDISWLEPDVVSESSVASDHLSWNTLILLFVPYFVCPFLFPDCMGKPPAQ